MTALFWTTLFVAALCLVPGVLSLMAPTWWRDALKAFPRNPLVAYFALGLGGLWFLYRIWHLSPADFGDYRMILLGIFGATWLGSFFLVKDFLAVRGVAVLVLMMADPVLDSAFGFYEVGARLWMVSLVFVAIALAIFLGAVPYHARRWILWLDAVPLRLRALGAGLVVYALILVVAALSYPAENPALALQP